MPRFTSRYMLPVLTLLALGGAGRGDPAPAGDKPAAKAGPAVGVEPGAAKPAKRRVYVLHSGIHTILANDNKNIAAETLREGLLARGVDDRDIVVMDNPFPTASVRNMFPKECFVMFAESSDPSSKVAQAAYLRLHKALQERGVKEDDEVVWVGHSAGGQMGMTVAYLAKNLDRFPALLRQAVPYQVRMVITLGAPVCANLLPKDVQLRHYYSPDDKVVSLVAKNGSFVLGLLGYRRQLHVFPPNLAGNAKIRVFFGIEHPYWDVDGRVLDRILREFEPDREPDWFMRYLGPGLGRALLGEAIRLLDQRLDVTVEEPTPPEEGR